MTQEQFNRAVEINKRLLELRDLNKELSNNAKLSYVYYDKYENDYKCYYDFQMKTIKETLDKYDIQIREDIKKEILSLEEEIEKL